MIKICIISSFIGAFSLALILSIMNGFEKVTHEQLRGIHAHVIVRAYGDALNTQALNSIFTTEFPQIASWSPTTIKQAIIQAPDSDDITNVTMIKAIDPNKETATTTLLNKITGSVGNNRSLATLIQDNHILIGKTMAQQLGIAPGSQVTLLFAPEDQGHGNKITLRQQTAFISGVFNTGIDEFDSGLIFCSFNFLNTLWPESGVQQINIKLTHNADEEAFAQQLRTRLGIEVYSWKDLYPALVAALKLEKYAMLFILALVVLIASMNIISLAFMHITQKRSDIAILQAMGMDITSLRATFLMVSVGTSLIGSVAGLACAGIVGWFLKTYPFITLPDTYYMSQLPIIMEWHIFELVFLCVTALSIIAAWIPTHKISHTTISHVLRFEA